MDMYFWILMSYTLYCNILKNSLYPKIRWHELQHNIVSIDFWGDHLKFILLKEWDIFVTLWFLTIIIEKEEEEEKKKKKKEENFMLWLSE